MSVATGPILSARPAGDRILICEDDRLIAMGWTGLLIDEGYTVVGPAYRAEKALEMAYRVARQSKPLVQRQSGIHPMVEQRSVGKVVSSPKPPEAGEQRARLYTSLTAGHHNSRMQLTLDDTHSQQ
jgi:hypothetical protein